MPTPKIPQPFTIGSPFVDIRGNLETLKGQSVVRHEVRHIGNRKVLFANVEHQVTKIAESIKIGRLAQERPLAPVSPGDDVLTVSTNGRFITT